MSAPSLYRRHRPRSFDDVVGQEHVVRTLRNAIEQDKVHHAYLFVGSRGTGKTSMAKILAASMNCQGDPDAPPAERRPGPTTHPCGRCESCRSIAEATSMDVVEMDAASNNSVDDIRDLRDAVAFAPVGGRHKVYILDEAHMLSSQAWNAFLKTLEEPPPRTIFVLATTEANKVLPTVVDRCHRFDFHRPTPDQLSRVLSRVAQQETIGIAPEAIALVARHATGSFRDALGTLEQLVTYAGHDITTEDVLSVLGVADAELLFRALDAVGAGDAAAALGVAAELSAQGRDLVQVTRDVEAHARALLLVKMTGGLPDELRISPDRDARTVAQAGVLSGAAIIRVIDLVAAALSAVRDGADPRTQLELLLVRAALPQIDPQAKALAARIARLEAAVAGGGELPAAPAAAPQAAAPAPPAAPERPAWAPPVDGAPSAPSRPGPADGGPSAGPGPSAPGAPAASAPASPASAPAASAPAPAERPAWAPPAPDDGPRAAPAAAARPAWAPPAPEDGQRAAVATPPRPAEPASRPASSPAPAPQADPAPAWDSTRAPAWDSTPAPAPSAPALAPDRSPTPDPGGWGDPEGAAPQPERAPQPDPTPAPSTPPDAWAADDGAPAAAPAGSAPSPAPDPPAPEPRAPEPAAAEPAAARPSLGVSASDVDELLPTLADQMPGNAVRAALGQAQTVSVQGTDLVLGVPAGKGSSARLLNRDDAKDALASALEELLGVRFVIRAEERAGLEAPEEAVLPEAELVRRVLQEFEAEELTAAETSTDAAPAAEATTPTDGDR
ncbi:DNA polymerase III subunit gamma/tau [Patulibacter sp. SYSU D01012]|uniref:DNA polymerase III subunit gamma/tau n=1 Tax=Patulibacter sp. SYSU D01012 TaxID=2817381 RepID=UPI001B3060CE